MRIVVSAEGTRGDLYPLLALGEACREAGHEVAVCASPHFEPEVAARGFGFRSSGIDVRAWLDEQAAAIVGGGLAMVRAQRLYLRAMLEHAFEALHRGTEGADLLVGAGVHVAGSTVARQRGIPYRYVAYCPTLLPSDRHTPVFMASQRRWPVFANRFAWRFLVPLLFRPILGGIRVKRREWGLPTEDDPFRAMLGDHPVLLATDAELAPPPHDGPLEVRSLGALQTDVEGPLPGKLQAFLADGEPPVFVGFGSMTDPDPQVTTRLLLEAVEHAGCRALLSRGWARLGEAALPSHVFPVDAVSHARLFPRVAAVVHHGGAGTTTTAARAGVPQILVPHLLDQHYWADRVVALGVGPPPQRRRGLSARRLGEAIRAVLDGDWLQHRAEELGQRLRAADPLRPEGRAALVAKLLGSTA